MIERPRKFWIFLYWLALGIVIFVEHKFLARQFRRRELFRRTVGIATVMGGAYPLVEVGAIDRKTWGVLLGGFGIAGTITAGGYIIDEAKEAKNTRERIRKGDTKIRAIG